jgi:hypothetical protein
MSSSDKRNCKSLTSKRFHCKRLAKKDGYCNLHFRINNKEKINCSVCYDEIIDLQDVLSCNHALCETCLKLMRDSRCPVCRLEMKSKKITKNLIATFENRKKEDTEKTNEGLLFELLDEDFIIYNLRLYSSDDNLEISYILTND